MLAASAAKGSRVLNCFASLIPREGPKIFSASAIRKYHGCRRQALACPIFGAFLSFATIVASASASEDVPIQELGGDQCFMFSNLLSYKTEGDRTIELPIELVINDQQEYRKLFDSRIIRRSCINEDLSKEIVEVDFSQKTVLGFWVDASCAATGFEKKVTRDDKQRLIIYLITVVEASIFCSGPGLESLNLVAIPKIPVGYKTVFEKLRR